MDATVKKHGNPNPILKTKFIGRLFFWWLKDLFWYGRKHDIVASDLYDVLPEFFSEPLSNKLETSWNTEVDKAQKSNRRPSLWRAIRKTYGLIFFKYSLLMVFSTTASMIQPTMLGLFISHFQLSSKTTTIEAYFYAIVMVALMISTILFTRHGYYQLHLVGMRARIACSSLMHRKITRLSNSAISQNNRSIINLLSNDVAKFELLAYRLPSICLAPMELVVSTYLMWRYVGNASLIAVSLLGLQTIPVQAVFYRVSRKLRAKLATKMDERLALLTEVFRGIHTIKVNVWEKYFEELVFSARSREIAIYIKKSFLTVLIRAFPVFTHRLAVYFTILVYTLQNGTISADKIFPMAQYLFIMSKMFSNLFSQAVIFIADVNVSMRRIENFLLLDETTSSVKKNGVEHSGKSISIKNVMTSWENNSIANTLQNINVDINLNKLYFVVGPVGAGKVWNILKYQRQDQRQEKATFIAWRNNTLLKLILGELAPKSGDIVVCGSISYVSQEPWLFTSSIKDNILFGQIYNEEKYSRVIKACALSEDFTQLPYGDNTLVGNRGVALSGGQCARINMARAVYRDADIYLFDDPLSAVDVYVAEKLFEDCINGLLKNKTRILVTHNLHYLKKADTIILLHNGKVEFEGSFPDFQGKIHYMHHLSPNHEVEKLSAEKVSLENINEEVIEPKAKVNESNEKEPQETEELLGKGKIAKSLYWKYIRSGGSYFMITMFILVAFLSISSIFTFDYWLKLWAEQEEQRSRDYFNSTILDNTRKIDQPHVKMSLYVCGALIATIVVTTILKNILFFTTCLRASKNLHNDMFACLIRTPLRFFEVNPSGRILNRFSEDTGSVDETMPDAMFNTLDKLSIVFIMILQVLVVTWWNVIPIFIVGYLLLKIDEIYVSTIQDIKRLEGIAKSPIFSQADSSLSGLPTIRSCGAQQLMNRNFDNHQDRYTAVHFIVVASTYACNVWLESLPCVLFALATFSFLAFKSNKLTIASDVGLALTQLLNVGSYTAFAMRQMAETAGQIINVERMFQFTQLKREDSLENENESYQRPPKFWPSKGSIIFDQVYLNYSENGEPVLKNLSFQVEPGAKVGIVGRTGAGKSSLISALFRLAKTDGLVLIDNIDVKNISLADLRVKISIIPQEPILFSGSLRKNLDPLQKYDDASLWSSLQDVELNKNFVSLDQSIEQGGRNLSAGQRQLLCLARAIVSRNKILVLDEATANVDSATDALIQRTVRIKFNDCTVLTIAHRLNTIIDSDKILVLHNGEGIEYDHPHVLLQRADSYFFKMVEQSGYYMSRHLKNIAEQVYNRKLAMELTNPNSKEQSQSAVT